MQKYFILPQHFCPNSLNNTLDNITADHNNINIYNSLATKYNTSFANMCHTLWVAQIRLNKLHDELAETDPYHSHIISVYSSPEMLKSYYGAFDTICKQLPHILLLISKTENYTY